VTYPYIKSDYFVPVLYARVPQKYNLSAVYEKAFPLSSKMRLKENVSDEKSGFTAVDTIKSPFPFDLEKNNLVKPEYF
jgi:hypothetical protein